MASHRHRHVHASRTAVLALVVAASCTPAEDSAGPVPAPSRFSEGYEVVADQRSLPGDLEAQAVLVDDPLRMPALWDHYRLGGEPPHFGEGREVALFVGTGESGSCPIEIEDVDVDGSDVTIGTADTDGPCTSDFVPRTFVFLFPAAGAPASGGTVTIQGAKLRIEGAEAVVPDHEVVFPVQDPSSFQMDALLEGVLVEDGGCLYVRGESSRRTILPIWPHGSGYRGSGDDIAVVDDAGRVVARVGEDVSMAGGMAPRPLPPELGQRVGTCRGPFWIAGETYP